MPRGFRGGRWRKKWLAAYKLRPPALRAEELRLARERNNALHQRQQNIQAVSRAEARPSANGNHGCGIIIEKFLLPPPRHRPELLHVRQVNRQVNRPGIRPGYRPGNAGYDYASDLEVGFQELLRRYQMHRRTAATLSQDFRRAFNQLDQLHQRRMLVIEGNARPRYRVPPPPPPPPPIVPLAERRAIALFVVGAKRSKKCAYCNLMTKHVCGICRVTPYCTAACQEYHWVVHEKYCVPVPPDLPLYDSKDEDEDEEVDVVD